MTGAQRPVPVGVAQQRQQVEGEGLKGVRA